MRVVLLSIGNTKPPCLRDAEAVYIKRLRPTCRIEFRSVRGEALGRSMPPGPVLKKEAGRLMACIPDKGISVVLDRRGVLWSSEELSRKIGEWQVRGVSALTFIIGGPLGLDSSVLERADVVVSLSPMTFNHDMVKLILLEQLYRAFSILKGEQYHK
jgi:23S rRNA (pseudouridine1915-N3)-methyltransferase